MFVMLAGLHRMALAWALAFAGWLLLWFWVM